MNQRAVGQPVAGVVDTLSRNGNQALAGGRNPRLRKGGSSDAENQRCRHRRDERDVQPHGLVDAARLRSACNAVSTASSTVVALVGALMMKGYCRRASFHSAPVSV